MQDYNQAIADCVATLQSRVTEILSSIDELTPHEAASMLLLVHLLRQEIQRIRLLRK